MRRWRRKQEGIEHMIKNDHGRSTFYTLHIFTKGGFTTNCVSRQMFFKPAPVLYWGSNHEWVEHCFWLQYIAVATWSYYCSGLLPHATLLLLIQKADQIVVLTEDRNHRCDTWKSHQPHGPLLVNLHYQPVRLTAHCVLSGARGPAVARV